MRARGLGRLAAVGLGALLVSLVLSTGGCADWFKDTVEKSLPSLPDIPLTDAGTIDLTAFAGVGDACDPEALIGEMACRETLRCVDGECKATGDTPNNGLCTIDNECLDGHYCSIIGVCQAAGEGVSGQACTTDGDCQQGLFCDYLGFSGVCAEQGAGDIGDPCDGKGDCFAGLLCGSDGACGPGGVAFGLRPWEGVECEAAADDTGPARVFFELNPSEFFRQPYPHDLRMVNGKIDLSGFPLPGPGIIGFDPVRRVKEAVESGEAGFSTSPTVFFRFSKAPSFGSITAKENQDTPERERTIYFVDVDPDSPGFGNSRAFTWFVTDGGGKYVCPRYLAARPSWTGPLAEDTTYAVVMLTGIETSDGERFEADADFKEIMTGSGGDAEMERARELHAPLKAWLDQEGIGYDEVLAAAVFTTQKITDLYPKLRDLAHEGPPPEAKSITECKPGVTSPCDDGLSGEEHIRGCFEESSEVYELHMRVPIPIVQKGTRPYAHPDDGGSVQLTPAGTVAGQGTEDVCVSLTIPKNVSMPAEGWPVGLYGHGTGGTNRSNVSTGELLASIDVDGTSVGVATLGWDGPMHGDRRGSDLDPEVLFYNFANPLAARGNLYQGATDVFALVRFLKNVTIEAADSPTGAPIFFDATKIMHIGHSQGATTGPLASPYEPDIALNVWSGAGAGLILSLLNKTQPADVKGGVAAALQEITDQGPDVEAINDKHPVLALIQGLFDAVDPLNHGRYEFAKPFEDVGPQHVLQFYGKGDSYTPPATISTFARVLAVDLVKPVVEAIDGMEPVDPPLSANKGGGTITGGLVQVNPSGYDGHFVMFRDAGAQKQLAQFIGTFVATGVPIIVAP